MSDIAVTINGRQYPIACEPKDIARIQDLAASIDQRLQALRQQMGPHTSVSDAHLLVLNALMMADELSANASGVSKDDTELMVRAVEHLTGRVQNIAQHLKTR